MQWVAPVIIVVDLSCLCVYLTRMIPNDIKDIVEELRSLRVHMDTKIFYPEIIHKGFEPQEERQKKVLGICIDHKGMA